MSISPPSYKQNRLKQLRAFCKTVETKNISRAAEKLFLTQPTISLQIKALERELDVVVFEQHGVPYSVVLEAGGWEVIKRYVEQDMGISIVNEICLTGKEKLAVIPLEDYFPRRTYGAVTRRGKFLTPPAEAFLDAMSTLQCKLPYKLAVAHGREEVFDPNTLDPRHMPTNIDDLD